VHAQLGVRFEAIDADALSQKAVLCCMTVHGCLGAGEGAMEQGAEDERRDTCKNVGSAAEQASPQIHQEEDEPVAHRHDAHAGAQSRLASPSSRTAPQQGKHHMRRMGHLTRLRLLFAQETVAAFSAKLRGRVKDEDHRQAIAASQRRRHAACRVLSAIEQVNTAQLELRVGSSRAASPAVSLVASPCAAC